MRDRHLVSCSLIFVVAVFFYSEQSYAAKKKSASASARASSTQLIESQSTSSSHSNPKQIENEEKAVHLLEHLSPSFDVPVFDSEMLKTLSQNPQFFLEFKRVLNKTLNVVQTYKIYLQGLSKIFEHEFADIPLYKNENRTDSLTERLSYAHRFRLILIELDIQNWNYVSKKLTYFQDILPVLKDHCDPIFLELFLKHWQEFYGLEIDSLYAIANLKLTKFIERHGQKEDLIDLEKSFRITEMSHSRSNSYRPLLIEKPMRKKANYFYIASDQSSNSEKNYFSCSSSEMLYYLLMDHGRWEKVILLMQDFLRPYPLSIQRYRKEDPISQKIQYLYHEYLEMNLKTGKINKTHIGFPPLPDKKNDQVKVRLDQLVNQIYSTELDEQVLKIRDQQWDDFSQAADQLSKTQKRKVKLKLQVQNKEEEEPAMSGDDNRTLPLSDNKDVSPHPENGLDLQAIERIYHSFTETSIENWKPYSFISSVSPEKPMKTLSSLPEGDQIYLKSENYFVFQSLLKPQTQTLPTWKQFLKLMASIIKQTGGKIDFSAGNGSAVSFRVGSRTFNVHATHRETEKMNFILIRNFILTGFEWVGITPKTVLRSKK